MSNGEPHEIHTIEIHTIDVGDHGFIIVERLTLTEREREIAPKRDIRVSSHIGGSGILQRLDRHGAIELIEALAEAAGFALVLVSQDAMTPERHNMMLSRENSTMLAFQRERAAKVTTAAPDGQE